MVETKITRDHLDIEEWVVNHGGRPAKEEGTFGELRVDFEEAEALERIDWDDFFEILDAENLAMEYEESINGDRPQSEKYDFVLASRDTPEDLPETEMDDEHVMANTEETN